MEPRTQVILEFLLIPIVFVGIYIGDVIMAPSWSFELTTDKPVYGLGENVQITVTLKNKGYVSHSFTAAIDSPVIVLVEYVSPSNPSVMHSVWYTPYEENETTFTLSPNQLLTRTYMWNQTNTQNPAAWNTTYNAGTYYIEAFIPKEKDSSITISSNALFRASVYINVTET